MISIIMPLYNAERFLEETLQSIKNQTFQEYELICIDDNSSDNTLKILNKWEKIDKRIKILKNEIRSGAAVSRNKGMKSAEGEYITFLDGDDLFDEEMLEVSYTTAYENNLDVVIYDYLVVDSKNIHEKRSSKRGKSYINKYCMQPFRICDINPIEHIKWNDGPCNKLYRKEFIDKINIEFQSLSCCNDVFFVEMALFLAEKIMVVYTEKIELYVRNHSEPGRISSDRDPMCIFLSMHKVLSELIVREKLHLLYKHFFSKFSLMILNELNRANDENKKINFYEFMKLKGTNILKEMGGEYYNQLPYIIKEVFERFLSEEYTSRWFEKAKNNEYVYGLELNKTKLKQLFLKNKRILVWGAGYRGSEFIDFLSNNSLDCIGVVDSNSSKWGKELGKYVVQNPKKLTLEEIDLIIVAIKNGFAEIQMLVSKFKLEVLFLDEIIDIYR